MNSARFLLATSLLLAVGCSDEPTETITLATTTSTRDSGLLKVLVPSFQDRTGIEVKTIAVGTGQALELGRRGDADVLLTHAPAAEQRFVADGYSLARQAVMYNDFVIVGPAADPAEVKGRSDVAGVLSQIAERAAPFVSRGDDSGTHMKEKLLWSKANVAPQGDWYIEAGAGMAATLRVCNEKLAYTLTDRGTFLAQRGNLDLVVISEGDLLLKNEYSVMVISPAKHPHVKHQAAQKFADFLRSADVQEVIAEFGVEEYGQPLFFPHGN